MERVKALINKLSELAQQNADVSLLMATVQQLQQELSKPVIATTRQPQNSTKISVVMPNNNRFMPAFARTEEIIIEEMMPKPIEAIKLVEIVKENKEVNEVKEIKKEPIEKKEIVEIKPEPIVNIPTAAAKVEMNGKVLDSNNKTNGAFTTTTQKTNGKEINDAIGHNGTSLNDKLKENKTELVETLTDAPIKDLKRGIGVNDRYVFVNELFRGDEVMYERSIKTINSFRILAEAEYWIQRELKVKQGWDDNKQSTQNFYQLVKRRFS